MKINDMNPLSGEIFIGLFLGLNKPILTMLEKKNYLQLKYSKLHSITLAGGSGVLL